MLEYDNKESQFTKLPFYNYCKAPGDCRAMVCINNIIFYSNGRKLVALQLKNNNIIYIDVIYESGVDIYSIATAEINGLLCFLIVGDEDTCRCIALPQWFTKEFMPEIVIRDT